MTSPENATDEPAPKRRRLDEATHLRLYLHDPYTQLAAHVEYMRRTFVDFMGDRPKRRDCQWSTNFNAEMGCVLSNMSSYSMDLQFLATASLVELDTQLCCNQCQVIRPAVAQAWRTAFKLAFLAYAEISLFISSDVSEIVLEYLVP